MRWAWYRVAHTVFWSGNLTEREHLEYLGVGDRIILNWIFKK
jgi:hypothetical protein